MTLNQIKAEIGRMKRTNPVIHVNVNIKKPRIRLMNKQVIIKAVYPNLFIIEENSTGSVKTHSLQYTDILTKQVEIVEWTQ